jgi:DUF3014 family protein
MAAMESGRAPADRPYLRPVDAPFIGAPIWLAVLVVALVGGVATYYFWQENQSPSLPSSPPHTKTVPAVPTVSAEPAIRHPLGSTGKTELPALQDSDMAILAALKSLFTEKSLLDLFYSDRLVLRAVATIDNLPRKTAPARMMPLKSVPGAFRTARTGVTPVIAAENSSRYRTYVRLARTIDTRRLVDIYVRFYPLFQRAYEELGYPKGYFNDRLIEAIDDLLEAPLVKTPVRLTRPKVLYQFEAEDLEQRSSGQKIMIRIGSSNAIVVKAKLREIRAALVARVARR